MVEKFPWSMQGYNFCTNAILFPLVGCDFILGMQWLKTLCAILWDCLNLTIEFSYERHKVKFVAGKEGRNQLLNEDKSQHQMRELQTYMIRIAIWGGDFEAGQGRQWL